MIKNLAYIGAKAAYRNFLITYYAFKSFNISEASYGKEFTLVELPPEGAEVTKSRIVIDYAGAVWVWYRPSDADPDEEFGDLYTLALSEYKKSWFLTKDDD